MAKKGLVIFKLGSIKADIYPTEEDLKMVYSLLKQCLPKSFYDDFDSIIYSPLLNVQVVNYEGSKTAVFKVGDKGKIVPEQKDLVLVKKLLVKALKNSEFYKTYKLKVQSAEDLVEIGVIEDVSEAK